MTQNYLMPRHTVLLAIAAALLTGCSAHDGKSAETRGGGSSSGQTDAGGGRSRAARIVPVAAASVNHRELERAIAVSGPIEPIRIVAISSQMSGTIRTLAVQEGASVRRGALVATLDAREVTAQLERARAALANAQSRHDRTKKLLERKLTTDAEYEQSLADLNVAQSDVRLWETRHGFTRITAPSSGVVTARLVEVGGTVAANQKILEVADVSTLVVRLRVSDLDVVHLHVGDRVDVAVDAYPGAAIEGRIRRIFPSADNSRLVPVEITIGRRPVGVVLRPGFLARVSLPLAGNRLVLAIPASAVAVGEEAPYVFVVRGDSVERRTVRTGTTSAAWVEVIEGLAEGDRVVVGGQTTLRTGTKVRVVSAADTTIAARDQ